MASIEISAQEVSDAWKDRYADEVASNVRLQLAFDRASQQIDELQTAVLTLTATTERQTELIAEKDRYITELNELTVTKMPIIDGESVTEDAEPATVPED